VQQRDQPGPGLIFDAAFTRDPRANCTGGAWQGFSDPGFQLVLLLHRQPTAAPFMAEACQTLDPVLLIELVPGPDRIVVENRTFDMASQLMPSSSSTSAFARRAS